MADTCTSELEACTRTFGAGVDTRMSERVVDTCTSEVEVDSKLPEQAAGIRKSEVGADTRVSQAEADRRILAEVVDSRLRAVGEQDAAPPCSIAVAHKRCMQPAVSGHSSMTSLVVE